MNEGDIIQLEYEAWIVETNELFDTTDEEVGKAHKLEGPRSYSPMTVIVGGGQIVKGLEDHIKAAEIGKEYEVSIPADFAYGPRDPKLVELHKIQELYKAPELRRGDQHPHVGMRVTLNNREGVITMLTAGRVRIDFNHPLAGKTLRYKYKVTKIAEDFETKARGLLNVYYHSDEGFKVEVSEEETGDVDVTFHLPDYAKYDQYWLLTKYRVVNALRKAIDGLREVRFIETYGGKRKDTDAEVETAETGHNPEDRDHGPAGEPDGGGETRQAEPNGEKDAEQTQNEKKEG